MERPAGISNLVSQEMPIYRFDIPLRDVFTIATMNLSKAQNLLVELRTNEGISGWGEASPFHSIWIPPSSTPRNPNLGCVEIKQGILTVPDTPASAPARTRRGGGSCRR